MMKVSGMKVEVLPPRKVVVVKMTEDDARAIRDELSSTAKCDATKDLWLALRDL